MFKEFKEEEFKDIIEAFKWVYFIEYGIVMEVYDKIDLLKLCLVDVLSRLRLRLIPKEVQAAVKEVVGDLINEYEMYVLKNGIVVIHSVKMKFEEKDADIVIENIRRFLRDIDKYKQIYTRVNERLESLGYDSEYYSKSLWIIEMLTDKKRCIEETKRVLRRKSKELIRRIRQKRLFGHVFRPIDDLNMQYWMFNSYIMYSEIKKIETFNEVEQIDEDIRKARKVIEGGD